ncbi:hypothetical protein AnigIFM63604_006008 [Aspergillus niger]|uniref:Uncharacterized protein n=1 Tax=Aspergillus niger TaxID=5061 RepID=A0A9W6EFF6_ASPNG|nr:hypothetical protein AnigIFM63604_006008 [Aspergillus niger]
MPSSFKSQYPRFSQNLQTSPSTPNALQNFSGSTHFIGTRNPNLFSREPTASVPRIQSRTGQQKRSIVPTVVTPESFRKQHQQDKTNSKNASKLIKCIQEVAAKRCRELEFYETLWDSTGGRQMPNHAVDEIHRYEILQQIVDDSAESEVKHIYRQRLAHLLKAHVLEVLDRSIPDSELSRGVTRRKLTIDKLSKSLRKDRKEISAHNTRSRHYHAFYVEFGPGAVILLGDSGNKALLENASSDNDVVAVIKYIRENVRDWIMLCEQIHFVVAISILKGMLLSGWDGKSDYDTTFMQVLGRYINLEAFRSHGKFQPHSKSGADPARNPNGTTHSRDAPLDPDCGPSDGVRYGASVDNSRRPQGNCGRPEFGLNSQALAWNTTTTTAETHRAGPLHNQALQHNLANVAGQASEPSSISSAVDDGNTNRVTKKRRSHSVKNQRKKPQISDNRCPEPRVSNAIDACYERSARATDYTVSLLNDNLTIDSILHSADQTTMETGFEHATAPIDRRAKAHSIFSQDAVNAAQLMQSFDVTSFTSASQLMQAFDMATFDFQESGQLVEDTNFAQSSHNVLQTAETPMQQ